LAAHLPPGFLIHSYILFLSTLSSISYVIQFSILPIPPKNALKHRQLVESIPFISITLFYYNAISITALLAYIQTIS